MVSMNAIAERSDNAVRGRIKQSLSLMGFLALANCLFGPLEGACAEPVDARIADYVAAGEFAPALRLARDSTDPQERDRWLEQIALAQSDAHAWKASLDTLTEMRDDRTRARVLGDMGGGPGGGVVADFDPLIELIKSTIAPPTWNDVGGPGSIDSFAGGGVFVDAEGVLRQTIEMKSTKRLASLLRTKSPPAIDLPPGDARRRSELRHVSLPRLEKEIQLLRAAGQEPTEAMSALAGMQRIQFVLVYPESGDLVLAGPAGDWRPDDERRRVSVDTGRPVVLLDDLVVVMRRLARGEKSTFGCTIDPTQKGLRRTQEYLAASADKKLSRTSREPWLREIRKRLGKQEIKVFGIDADTHAARVIVAADYHMKLVGVGLAEGVRGMESYLASIKVQQGEAPPALDVLRWWFTLNYQAVAATPDRLAFEIRGPGAKVLSENQLMAEQGRRIATGRSEELNQQFANSFTRHFDALAEKYPVYSDLRNLFDLALVGALIESEDLAGQVDWNRTEFGESSGYRVARGPAPRRVESVINHRRIKQQRVVHTIACVSGGVSVDPWSLVQADAIVTPSDTYRLDSARGKKAPDPQPRGRWWWD